MTVDSSENKINLLETFKKGIFWVFSNLRYLWKKDPHSVVFFLIIILATILRFYRLEILPQGLSPAEFRLLEKVNSFSRFKELALKAGPGNGLYEMLIFLTMKFFGIKIFLFRSLSAVIGILTVVFIYLFTKEWYNKQTAYLAAILLSFSSWHITLSRNINPSVLLPLTVLVILFLASHAFRSRNIVYVILSGISLGIGMYTIPTFPIFLIFLLFAVIYFYKKNKNVLKVYLREIAIVINAFILVSLPYFINLAKSPSAFFGEYMLRGVGFHLANFGSILLALFSHSDYNNYYNLGYEALLDPLVLILFLTGIIFLIFNLHSRKNSLLLLWIFLSILPGVFAKDIYFEKIVGLIPVVYVLAAVILDHIMIEWFSTFPLNKKARSIMVFLVTGFMILSFGYNYNRYFVAWAGSDSVKEAYSADPLLLK